jgi:ankyrin repeat protein
VALASAASACGGRARPLVEVAHTESEDHILEAIGREPAGVLTPDRFGVTALHYAAKRGMIGPVQRLARNPAAVDAVDARGETPLYLAVRENHIECAYELLAAGANPQSRNGPTGATPMHMAAQIRAVAIAQLLRRWGAAIDATNHWGQTPLHVAAAQFWHGDTAMAAWLLDQGASADVRDAEGFSPLQSAAFYNNLPVLELLLSRGISVEERTSRGATLLDLAIERNADVVAQYLFERQMPTARTSAPLPPLHAAAELNDPGFAALLLSYGATPGFAFRGETALQLAEREGHRAVAALLRASAAGASR